MSNDSSRRETSGAVGPDGVASQGSRNADTWIVLALAATPFAAKAVVLVAGLTGYGLQSIYKLFQLAVPCFWRFRRGQSRGINVLWPTDERLPDVRTWLIGVVAAVVLSGSAIAAANWLLPRLELDPTRIRAGLDARFPISAAGAVAVVLFLSVANSALEELHFRAWLDREISSRWGAAAGIAVSAAAFGAMHVLIFSGLPDLPTAASLLVALALAGAGVTWSLVMRLPGGIHAAWLSHGLTDAILLGWGLHWLGYV